MITAKLSLPLFSETNEFDVKISLFNDPLKNVNNLIKTEKIIEFDPNHITPIDADFEFNNEPYYEPYNFSFIKIQTEDRKLALLIIEERYCIKITALKENNKSLQNDFAVNLNNCGIYQLKKNELIIKPNDVSYL